MDYAAWDAAQTAKRDAAYKAERQAAREHRQFVRQAERGTLSFVYCTLPRCPECGGAKHKSYRSVDNGDGTRMRWTRCECGEKFIIVLE